MSCLETSSEPDLTLMLQGGSANTRVFTVSMPEEKKLTASSDMPDESLDETR